MLSTHIDRGIAFVLFEGPSFNALSIGNGLVAAMRKELGDAVANRNVSAIVLRGGGSCFCSGADIADFDQDPERVDEMRELYEFVANADKPTIMALHGMALGGGLELALAGRYRVSTPDTRLGFPEVTLGLLPGGGGTQRLPRLLGAGTALELMLEGRPITATRALTCGLIDRVVESLDDVDWHALKASAQWRVVHTLPATDADGAVDKARAALARRRALGNARRDIIDCVATTLRSSFEEGLRFEAQRFGELMQSEASAGLRHAFFAARRAAQIPSLPSDLPALKIERCAVIGAGTMGSGIALALIGAGLTVTLVEPRADALKAATKRIGSMIDREVEKGRYDAAEATARRSRLRPAVQIAAVADADLVIEAVFEDMAVKRQVFAAVERVAKPSAILASNTSTLDLNALASSTAHPERVVGMHFFSPAHVMRLLEVVRGARTAPAVLAAAMAFAKRIAKIGVVAGVCDGFIGNRIFEEYLRQAYFLVEEGALPQQVDNALEAWGMAMGPFRTMDLAGQDIGWSIRKRRAITQPDRPYSKLPDQICEMGRFGQKTGAGFYLYPDGRTAEVDPEIDALVLSHSARQGINRRVFCDAEIVERCIFAMVNEGAKLLQEGIAYRPLDIDVVYLNGYGFPPERGGPMFHADRLGLQHVLSRITEFANGRHGWAWAPAELLLKLTSERREFSSLNG